jgi:hypothetical protein
MERLPKDTGPGNEGGGGRVLRERNLALRWRMYVSSRDADTDVDWVPGTEGRTPRRLTRVVVVV